MRTIAPEQMNNPLTFNDLLTGNITIYLDMEWETILEDGRFGCNTQGALQKVRNRKSITLNEF